VPDADAVNASEKSLTSTPVTVSENVTSKSNVVAFVGVAPARTIDVNGEARPYLDQTRWVGITGVAYLPATVVPIGRTRAGLPVGVQIAGPFLEDRTPLDLARRLSELIGGFTPPPGY